MSCKEITVAEVKTLMETNEITVIDIRDQNSYAAGHIEDALHVDDSNVAQFIREADFEVPLVVCCYHGNNSQGAAAYMSEQGFEEAYSLRGGFAAWNNAS